MKIFTTPGAALKAAVLNLIIPSVAAHSWVEFAIKLAPNGTMIGEKGYPRGYIPRTSTNPPFKDTEVTNLLPPPGQPFYSGGEILNRFKFDSDPQYPMLEAAAGDYIAITHLENGHTTIPSSQPDKPRNRGTIYFYGTTQPKEQEKLFDVHLLWNKDGTGGDGRGKLLATRNYDDGQCFQSNDGELSTGRAAELADRGAIHAKELGCQSDFKLPDDLNAGDIYTIYWYWDWPDLNFNQVDEEGTKKGLFPWAGTFMRGEEDPNGYTMAGITKNESYSCVVDIKIAGPGSSGYAAKGDLNVAQQWVPDQDIYSMGILEQMSNNFQVDVGGGQGSGTGSVPVPTSTVPAAAPTPILTTLPGNSNGGGNGGIATVTVTTTVQPPPSITTVYVTVPAESMTSPPPSSTPRSTSTFTKIITHTRGQGGGASSVVSEPTSTPQTTSTVTKTVLTTVKHGTAPAAADETSTVKMTSTTIKTMTTEVANAPPTVVAPESTSVSFPGGQFRETPASSSPGGVPTPSPFLRRRNNWAMF